MTSWTEIEQPMTGTPMQATEYFMLPETNKPIELLNGEIYASPPPIPDHQRSVGSLYALLRTIIPNGELFLSPIAVYLDEDNVPEPDILWIAANSRCVVAENRLEGPPDLIVEVLSPSTARHDRTSKFLLVERFGVREYWLADPAGKYLEVFTLEENRYLRLGAFGPEDKFKSPVLDQHISLETIF